MQHHISSSPDFQNLIRKIAGAFPANERYGLLQTLPLFLTTQPGFPKGDHARVQFDITGETDKVPHIHRHNDLAMDIGIAPDLSIGLSPQTNIGCRAGFQTELIRPTGEPRRKILIAQQLQPPILLSSGASAVGPAAVPCARTARHSIALVR